MKTKKIGFLLEFFPPNTLSSATLPFSIVNELLLQNFHITVVTGYEKNNTFDSCYLNKSKGKIQICRIKYFRSKSSKLSKLFSMVSFFFSTLFKLHKFKHIDSLFVFSNPPINNLLGYLAKKIYKIRVIFVVYDFYPDIAYFTNQLKKESIIFKFYDFINQKIYDGNNDLIVLSDDMKKYLLSRFPKLINSIHVIPNWYEDLFENYLIRKNNHITNIGYFGNLGITQDFEALKKILLFSKDIKSIHFTFSGHGNYYEDLYKFISTNNITNISFFNYLNQNDYLRKLSEQDIVLLTLNKNINQVAAPSRLYSFLMMGVPVLLLDHSESSLSIEIERNSLGKFINLNNTNLEDEFRDCIVNLNKYSFNDINRYYRSKYIPKINIEKYVKLIS
jgi:glycosyltransferase involved in cell wall biosynthesis